MWLAEHLAEGGYDVSTFETGGACTEAFHRQPCDLVLLDLKLPDRSGLQVLEELRAADPTLPVIMISAHGEVETAVAAVRAGAFHFLEKPVELAQLLVMVEQALQTRRLLGQLERYREGHRWQFSDVALVGRSPALEKVADTITRLGTRGTPSTVLVRGESGTGKDVIARAIHARGPRQDNPFLSVNCTALPETLVESELFGHEAGAYTDAKQTKRGLFELADGGTVLLDEVGDMPPPGQAKLLQFLETHRFRRVGGVRDLEVDVQVIAATHRDLESAVQEGTFREDLFYRLNVIPIELPPLRERPEDIVPLAAHFLDVLTQEMSLSPRGFDEDALSALESYPWPGNARELRNVIERLLLLTDDECLSVELLPPEITGASIPPDEAFPLPSSGVELESVEKALILQALERTSGNKSRAARLLGISRDTLRYRLEKHGPQRPTAPWEISVQAVERDGAPGWRPTRPS
jgi:DNA-binding NtrC family response regulator